MANGETVAGAVYWQFFHAGDFDQVVIRTGGDLLSLELLDKKLWAALSCPVYGLEFDSHTLALIDSDKDDRIRAPEIIEAVHFSHGLLKSLDIMVEGGCELPLDLMGGQYPRTYQHSFRGFIDLTCETSSGISPSDQRSVCRRESSWVALYADRNYRFGGGGRLLADKSVVTRP